MENHNVKSLNKIDRQLEWGDHNPKLTQANFIGKPDQLNVPIELPKDLAPDNPSPVLEKGIDLDESQSV